MKWGGHRGLGLRLLFRYVYVYVYIVKSTFYFVYLSLCFFLLYFQYCNRKCAWHARLKGHLSYLITSFKRGIILIQPVNTANASNFYDIHLWWFCHGGHVHDCRLVACDSLLIFSCVVRVCFICAKMKAVSQKAVLTWIKMCSTISDDTWSNLYQAACKTTCS